MDSNGRQRTSLPGSNTFRRLPTLTRSPFRRADKSASPVPPEHHETTSRVSTFPSLARVVVDDTSLSSALFGTSIQENPPAPIAPPPSVATRSLSGSSIPQTTVSSPGSTDTAQLPVNANAPSSSNAGYAPLSSPLSPFPYKAAPRAAQPMSAHASPLPTVGSPPPAGFDLEPITYPAHLAQTRPPPHDASAATPPPPSIPLNSPSPIEATSPVQAPAVPARSAHRYRDFTLGSSAMVSAMNLTTQNLAPGMSPLSAPNGNPAVTVTESALSRDSPVPGVRRPSASGARKPSMSTNPRRDGDDSADDTGNSGTPGASKRRPGSKAPGHRPPKARERDVPTTPATDGDDVLPGRATLAPSLPAAPVERAPPTAMYFSPVGAHGRPPAQALRAHTGTLVGDRIWFLGGVDARSCWRGVASFDTEALLWSTVETHGEALPPLRAHTTTLVGDRLYVFGGGDGPTYSNDVWVFDTITHRFSRPAVARGPLPPPRRAHTTVLYKNFLVVFGGGNGQAALNDVWALDISDPGKLQWQEWRTRGDVPQKKGYHTANLIEDRMVVFGGSDGHASFADVHVLDLKSLTWTLIQTEVKHNRLSHTSTQVGSYLFVLGGHNGQTYAQDVLLFNLTTMAWEAKVPRGNAPPGRGYHVAVLHDARIFISGGYNGVSVFEDMWCLDLAAGAYLPQVQKFKLDETGKHFPINVSPVPPSAAMMKNGPANRI